MRQGAMQEFGSLPCAVHHTTPFHGAMLKGHGPGMETLA